MSDQATRTQSFLATASPGDQLVQDFARHARIRRGLCCNLTGWFAPWTRCECQREPSTEEADRWLPPEVHKITEPPPQALLDAQVQRWTTIGLATGPTDEALMLKGFELAYAEAGLELPSVERFDSPHAASSEAARDSAWDSVWRLARDSAWRSVRGPVRDSVRDSVVDSVVDSVLGPVLGPVWDSVWYSAWRPSWPSTGWAKDAHWIAFYETFLRLGLRAPRRLRGLSWVCESTGIWWPNKDRVLVSERPDVLEIEDGKLVYAKWPDGTELGQ